MDGEAREMSSAKIRQFTRYSVAILFGYLLGSTLAFPFSFIIDLIAGQSVTGAPWALSIPNLIYNSTIGLFGGFIAIKISGNRWILTPVLAQLFPMVAVIILELVLNRAPVSRTYIHPSFWIYAGLLPAILGGYLGDRAHLTSLKATLAVIILILLFVLSGGGVALHIYTTIMAYHLSGIGATFVTLILPGIAELYWWIASWHASGAFITGYSRWCLLYLIVIVLLLLAFIGRIVTDATLERSSATMSSAPNTPIARSLPNDSIPSPNKKDGSEG